ncbi:MAG TPA: ester cyclase [Gaiellaceae bacterium]|nr:ester cyclase [Gaiellaceae bacterium]
MEDLPLRWAAAWSAHDPDGLASLFAEDGVYEDVTFQTENHGHHGVSEWATGFLAAFPDLGVEPRSLFLADERAILEWTMGGTHRGTLGDMAATGKRFEVRGVTLFTFRAGLIARCSDYWDLATVQRQLGYVARRT